ncbi:MAG: OmpA family protein [Proteobacteria bacterium]|nr:OmpA family protein [Pseudomonadota bacterium]
MALSAPSRADVIFDNTSGIGLETTGTVFMNGLYEGYEALSEERTWATDLLDGEHFNHKARRAARRSSVMPDEIMDRDLLEADIPDLSAGLVRLRTAYDRGGRTIAPELAATAQVSFDCWIEAAEGVNPATGLRTHSAWRQEDVERCRDQFEKAMAELEPLTTYRLTEFRKPAGTPAAPMPVPQIAAAPEPFTVYFAWDSEAVDGAGNRVIDDAVAAADDLGIVDYTITGHADRSGAEDYNLQLSLRRADAVRSALISRGVKEGGISVAGRGEAEPAVQTADGVREPANRRVEIILL